MLEDFRKIILRHIYLSLHYYDMPVEHFVDLITKEQEQLF